MDCFLAPGAAKGSVAAQLLRSSFSILYLFIFFVPPGCEVLAYYAWELNVAICENCQWAFPSRRGGGGVKSRRPGVREWGRD